MAAELSLQRSMTEQVSPELYTGQKTADSGATHYFGMEKLDDVNFVFWNSFLDNAQQFASNYSKLCRAFCAIDAPQIPGDADYATTYPSSPHPKAIEMGYSEQEYHQVMQFIQKKRYFRTGIFPEVKQGILGMHQVMAKKHREGLYIHRLSFKKTRD